MVSRSALENFKNGNFSDMSKHDLWGVAAYYATAYQEDIIEAESQVTEED